MPEKAALLELMDRVAGADSLDEVYQSALKCLQLTLGIERASLLIFDHQDVMRFVAWTGLSEPYRRAVDGHSPWQADEPNARPILVADVRVDADLERFRHLFEQEQIQALAFVPLRFGSKLLGKFMLYYAKPHRFATNEVTIAETVAGHVAYALEHHRIAGQLETRLRMAEQARLTAEQEVALREEQERKLHLALESGEMGTWEWDIERGRVTWSRELERIHGLKRGTFGGSFEDFQRDMHPQDQPRVREAIERTVGDGSEYYEVEYRIVREDGEIRYVSSRGRLLKDREERPVRMIGICGDVTARKLNEQAQEFLADAGRILATSLEPDEILRRLAQIAVPRLADWCVVFAVNEQGLIEPVEVTHREKAKVDQAWEMVRRWRTPAPDGPVAEVIEHERSVLIARVDHELLASRAESEEHLQLLESLGLHSVMIVPLRARGRVLGALTLIAAESRRIFDQASLRFAEDIASWAALALDNAQLYSQAEQARAVTELTRERLQILAEVSDALVASLDPAQALRRLAQHLVATIADYCITYSCDGSDIRRLGIAHRLPEKWGLVQALEEAGPPRLSDTAGAGAVIRTGEDILVKEVTADMVAQGTANARHREVVLALAPCSTILVALRARGTTLGALALVTTRDSGRRYDEEDFQLAREIANRAAIFVDNARLFSQAQAAICARDEMLAVVSHDVRSPLQSISMAANILACAPPAEQQKKSIESIALATTHVDRLLQDLFDITRLETGRLSIRREATDVVDLIDEARKLYEPLAVERSVNLHSEVADGIPAVAIDRGRMLQVLSNLLGNAIKFAPENSHVVLTGGYADGKVRIAVTDDGPGIEEQHLERVFERFWKANRRTGPGAGLGLAIAKGIVESHDGVIGVESRPGEGSTFYVLLDAEAHAA
ncbi:MAG: GAF domain-containing protein [Woeseia sp.]